MIPAQTRNALFGVTGILLLTLAFSVDQVTHPDGHALLFSIGIVTLSVTILDLLWNLAGGNPIESHLNELSAQVERLAKTVDVIESAKQIGLESIHTCAGTYGDKIHWFNIMESASVSMDLMGRTLHEWIRAPEFDEILIRKITLDGIRFRWLLMSPNNIHISQLEEDGGKIGESLEKKIDQVCQRLKQIHDDLPPEKKKNLQVRVFERIPLYCSVLRVDEGYFITPYLQSVGSKNCPFITVRGKQSPWAISYDREFETIWNDSLDLLSMSEIRSDDRISSRNSF